MFGQTLRAICPRRQRVLMIRPKPRLRTHGVVSCDLLSVVVSDRPALSAGNSPPSPPSLPSHSWTYRSRPPALGTAGFTVLQSSEGHCNHALVSHKVSELIVNPATLAERVAGYGISAKSAKGAKKRKSGAGLRN
jgi:hypothetical protein